MIFNSFDFLFFFASFFILYWFVFVNNLKLQNLLILAGSYFFYAWWDWRFLSLLIASSALNYFLGIYIGKTQNEKHQRYLVLIGIVAGVGTLLFFKYFNFFIDTTTSIFSIFGVQLKLATLQLILPLGISFYTFRSISYLLDVESEKIEPTKDWIVFFSYISFFPSLLSGPIDRAEMLVPQLQKNRTFNYNLASEGMAQILWGLFKKLVIADNCAFVTQAIFENYTQFSASTLLLGSFFYIIQVYADFSGYSDMAIGFAKLLGFRITQNFNYPFFAQNIAEHWQRWHISLTSWMTEYVYTPLSFNFRSLRNKGIIISIIINFILVGLWHGANWTFVVFGLLNGCYFIPLILSGALNKKRTIAKDKLLPSIREIMNMGFTFSIVMLTAIIFGSKNMVEAFGYYSQMCSLSLFTIPPELKSQIILLMLIMLMFSFEWMSRDEQFGLIYFRKKLGRVGRWCLYVGLIFTIGMYMQTNETAFLYFKF
ncbi:MAG TPA: MBOAT family O-acyltransferase [Bacteroidia bacterium]|nr:MBOAT family O-acyltransferase [Bacteroidia bacterium]